MARHLPNLLPGNPFKGEPPVPKALISTFLAYTVSQVEPDAPEPEQEPSFERPGCMAADESGLVLYHLKGLADGRGGFGLLRTDVDRLEKAARGAAQMGDHETASNLRSIKQMLPDVRSEERAREVARALEELARETWELGKKCGKMHGLKRPS